MERSRYQGCVGGADGFGVGVGAGVEHGFTGYGATPGEHCGYGITMTTGTFVGDGCGVGVFALGGAFAPPCAAALAVVAGSVGDPPPPHAASAIVAKVANSVRIMSRILHENPP